MKDGDLPTFREVLLLFALAGVVAIVLYLTWGERSPVHVEKQQPIHRGETPKK